MSKKYAKEYTNEEKIIYWLDKIAFAEKRIRILQAMEYKEWEASVKKIEREKRKKGA